MNTTELRPGNLVETYHGSLGWKQEDANEITYYGMGNNYGELVHSPQEIRPIPLTEEWLVKFGFEHKSSNEYVKDRFVYRKRNRDLVINGFEYDYNGITAYPEYVHQLQNLYFAITGGELQL